MNEEERAHAECQSCGGCGEDLEHSRCMCYSPEVFEDDIEHFYSFTRTFALGEKRR